MKWVEKRPKGIDADLGQGSRRTYGYDANDRLTTQIEANAALAPIATFIDTYDPVGNRTRRVQDGVQTDWTYDALYRLTGQQATGAWATFSYDATGNVLSKAHQGQNSVTMSYDAAGKLATSIQGAAVTTYAYDGVGNLSSENAGGTRTTYGYEGENRLATVVSAAGRSTYTYQGGDGPRRTKHEPSGSMTTMVWDGDDYLQERSRDACDELRDDGRGDSQRKPGQDQAGLPARSHGLDRRPAGRFPNEDGHLELLALRRGEDKDRQHRHPLPVRGDSGLLPGRFGENLRESPALPAPPSAVADRRPALASLMGLFLRLQ